MFIRGSIRLGILVLAFLCWFALRAQTNTAAGAVPRAGRDDVQIPAGTILPVRLNHGFSSKNARAGQRLTGRIMQDVPLPGSGKIPEGSKVIGTILSVSSVGNNSAGRITLQFAQIEIHHRRMAMVTSLRAIASPMEVAFAQIPETTPGFGTPYVWEDPSLIEEAKSWAKAPTRAYWFTSKRNLSPPAAVSWTAITSSRHCGFSPLTPAECTACPERELCMQDEPLPLEK
jgi:hypothetical protein